jgi:hypothetical protein
LINKNNELGNNNRKFGKERNQAQQKLTDQLEENNNPIIHKDEKPRKTGVPTK